jgi:hypothetical protein
MAGLSNGVKELRREFEENRFDRAILAARTSMPTFLRFSLQRSVYTNFDIKNSFWYKFLH